MASKLTSKEDKEYVEFIIKRLKCTDFKAESKLRSIDEMADIVFNARKNYRKSKTK